MRYLALVAGLLGLAAAMAAIILLLTGCASATLARDLSVYAYGIRTRDQYWTRRGQRLGDLAFLYCAHGSEIERRVMAWAIEQAAHPAQVIIVCPPPP